MNEALQMVYILEFKRSTDKDEGDNTICRDY